MSRTTDDLLKLIQEVSFKEPEKDSNFRYVLYLRRSTDENGKQYRSLGDQRVECMEYAKNLGLRVVDVIEESQIAKESGIRPNFAKMLKGISNGQYDAILSWHPDRLARNMKDAGEIIDMLDRNIIKDIKFKSFSFDKSPSGKMLLGLAFVLSKEYSDKLSVNVKRGVKLSTRDGKVLIKAKHGYYKDRNKFLRPDGENYNLMRNAWKMRLEGKSLDEIADYLNLHKYSLAIGTGQDEHGIAIMSKKRLSDLFRTPVYAGILKVGTEIIDLTKMYEFVPMVSVDEFCELNKIDSVGKAFVSNLRVNRGIVKANLLRGKIICGHCRKKMSATITKKKFKNGKIINYFYFRCETDGCSFKNKSIRAKIIRNCAADFLETYKFNTKANYEHYLNEMKNVREIKNKEFIDVIRILKQELKKLNDRNVQIKDYILESRDIMVKNVHEGDFKANMVRISDLEIQISDLNKKIENNVGSFLTYEKFLELFNNLPKELRKKQKMEWLNGVLTKIFLNFTVIDNKVAHFTVNSPFREFIKSGNVTISESKRTRTSDLFNVNEAL